MSLTVKDFAARGLVAGAVGGGAAALFIRVVTETQIGFALEFEDAAGLGGPAGEAAEFSRGTQYWGGMAAALLYGAVIGLALGVAVAALHHRVRGHDEFGRVARVAAGAFVAVVLIPFLKYPANPPAVGNDDTIDDRAEYFLLMLVASLLAAVFATALGQRLRPRFGTWNAALLGIGGYLAAVTVVMVALKDIAEVPEPLVDPQGTIVFAAFPGDVLADFRVYAIASQVVLWSAIGLVFAPLADRLLASGRLPSVAPPREPAEA